MSRYSGYLSIISDTLKQAFQKLNNLIDSAGQDVDLLMSHKDTVDTHMSDHSVHITPQERDKWNGNTKTYVVSTKSDRDNLTGLNVGDTVLVLTSSDGSRESYVWGGSSFLLESDTDWANINVNADSIVQDSGHKFVTDAQINTWNAKAGTAVATPSADGLMSSTDKGKLDNLQHVLTSTTGTNGSPVYGFYTIATFNIWDIDDAFICEVLMDVSGKDSSGDVLYGMTNFTFVKDLNIGVANVFVPIHRIIDSSKSPSLNTLRLITDGTTAYLQINMADSSGDVVTLDKYTIRASSNKPVTLTFMQNTITTPVSTVFTKTLLGSVVGDANTINGGYQVDQMLRKVDTPTFAGLKIGGVSVTRKYSAFVPPSGTNTVTITHNLGTTDVVVSVYDMNSKQVLMDVTLVDANSIKLSANTIFNDVLYRVVIVG